MRQKFLSENQITFLFLVCHAFDRSSNRTVRQDILVGISLDLESIIINSHVQNCKHSAISDCGFMGLFVPNLV